MGRAKETMTPLDWFPAAIRKRSTLRQLDAGEALFHQGDKATAIFEVERGHVRLVRHTIDNRAVVLHAARSGEMFAEAALFSSTYRCDAVAAMHSRVRAYPKRELRAAFRKDPAFAERFMAALAHQIHDLRSRLEERNIRSARERVVHHLVLAAGAEGRTVRLEGTVMELAAEIGLTHEVLYRTLAALEKEGTIARTGAEIALRKTQVV
jgi:CRP-like cAMP-binding protein